MAEITSRSELSTLASGDKLFVRDVSDDTDSASGTDKWAALSALRNWYNVKDYGATGDGTTNDTTAVQAAIDAAKVNGGVVFYTHGTYSCDALTTYINVLHQGAGLTASIIQARSAITLFTLSTEDVTSKSSGGFRDLTLDGNDTGTYGADMRGMHTFGMFRCRVHQFTNTGLRMRAVLISYFYDCEFRDNGQYGVTANADTLTTSGTVRANLLRFINCRIMDNPTYGLSWNNSVHLVLDGCDIERNGTTGNNATGSLYLLPYDHGIGARISNCWFEDNKGFALMHFDAPPAACTSVVDFSLMGNNSNATYGVYVDGGGSFANKVVCREVITATGAGTEFFADGANATIVLENCTGTTGGTGTIS